MTTLVQSLEVLKTRSEGGIVNIGDMEYTNVLQSKLRTHNKFNKLVLLDSVQELLPEQLFIRIRDDILSSDGDNNPAALELGLAFLKDSKFNSRSDSLDAVALHEAKLKYPKSLYFMPRRCSGDTVSLACSGCPVQIVMARHHSQGIPFWRVSNTRNSAECYVHSLTCQSHCVLTMHTAIKLAEEFFQHEPNDIIRFTPRSLMAVRLAGYVIGGDTKSSLTSACRRLNEAIAEHYVAVAGPEPASGVEPARKRGRPPSVSRSIVSSPERVILPVPIDAFSFTDDTNTELTFY